MKGDILGHFALVYNVQLYFSCFIFFMISSVKKKSKVRWQVVMRDSFSQLAAGVDLKFKTHRIINN